MPTQKIHGCANPKAHTYVNSIKGAVLRNFELLQQQSFTDVVDTNILWLPTGQDTAAICSVAEACECSVNQPEKKNSGDTTLQQATKYKHYIYDAQLALRKGLFLHYATRKCCTDATNYKIFQSPFIVYLVPLSVAHSTHSNSQVPPSIRNFIPDIIQLEMSYEYGFHYQQLWIHH
jgi:hypothetical protein